MALDHGGRHCGWKKKSHFISDKWCHRRNFSHSATSTQLSIITALTWNILTLSWVILFLFVSHSRRGVVEGEAAVRPLDSALTFHMLLNLSTDWRGNEPSDWAVIYWAIYKSLVLWSRTAKDPVNREETDCSHMQQYNPRVHHQILILLWMWSLALEQVGDNTNTMLNGIPCYSSAWEQTVNGDDCQNPIHHQWSTSPYCQPQESQVARSQIKHADEHRRAKSRPCLGGCFCAAEPHWHSRCNFLSLLSPLPANKWCSPNSVNVLTPLLAPLWVWECCHRKEMDKWGGRDSSAAAVPWLTTGCFSVHE